MQRFVLGSIVAEPLSRHPHLVAAPVSALVERLRLGDAIGAFEIDPEMSETAATQARYDLDPASLVNCVWSPADVRARSASPLASCQQRSGWT